MTFALCAQCGTGTATSMNTITVYFMYISHSNSILREVHTSSKFCFNPLSYGHGFILCFSYISILVQLTDKSFKCIPKNPSRLKTNAELMIKVRKISIALRNTFTISVAISTHWSIINSISKQQSDQCVDKILCLHSTNEEHKFTQANTMDNPEEIEPPIFQATQHYSALSVSLTHVPQHLWSFSRLQASVCIGTWGTPAKCMQGTTKKTCSLEVRHSSPPKYSSGPFLECTCQKQNNDVLVLVSNSRIFCSILDDVGLRDCTVCLRTLATAAPHCAQPTHTQ